MELGLGIVLGGLSLTRSRDARSINHLLYFYHAAHKTLEMPQVRAALCKPESIAFLFTLYAGGAFRRKDSIGDRLVSGVCEIGKNLRSRAYCS